MILTYSYLPLLITARLYFSESQKIRGCYDLLSTFQRLISSKAVENRIFGACFVGVADRDSSFLGMTV
jgi:hypothetical protein